ncbi:MAG: ADP-ribosylglycohydrolase family protein [Nanoarchaeota archaeon]
MPTLEERFTGTLIGLAVGDALGGPVEEIPKHPCMTPRPVTEMIGGGYLKLLPGQITDDTEMTLCLARSLAEKKEFDPADIAKRFMEWFYDSPIGTGKTTRVAMARLKEGIPWNEAGRNPTGNTLTGNGSVMRCAPISLFNYARSDLTAKHSAEQSIITHPHPDCVDSSVFVNILLYQVLHEEEKTKAFHESLPWIRHNPDLMQQYGQILGLQELRTTGKVRDTVETAVHSFLTTSTFEEAVARSANLGGDADTIAAITGAMAGAYYGEKAIPMRWKDKLVDRHGKPIHEELSSLGKSLYSLAT